jgi:N-acetylneuraminic acid mutarotase
MKNRTPHARKLCVLVTVLGLIGAATSVPRSASVTSIQTPTPTWTLTGNLNTGRDSQTATLLLNGKVLVAGGNNSNGTLKSAELYNPESGTWSNTGDLTTSRAFHTATLLANGKVLIAGGFTCAPPPASCSQLTSAELYDPANGTWSTTGSLNTARDSHTATMLQNGKVLAVGGFLGDGGLSEAELYDPATGIWNITGNLNVGRYVHTATLLQNGKVLVTGGYDNSCGSDDCPSLGSAELYDPVTATWTLTDDLHTGRSSHTAVRLVDGKILVAGGFNFPNETSLNSAELYDPAAGTWTASGDLNSHRVFQAATLLPNGKILVAGGFNTDNAMPNILSSAELYDPATGLWSNTASLNIPRRFHSETLLLNGKVLVVGGSGPDAANSAEICDPGTPGPNIVALSAATFSASEGAGSISITFTRAGDTSGAAIVDYATSDAAALHNCDVLDGAASARCDYATASGTVHFAAGQTSKSISIPMVDDSFAEGSENFTITLSNASGASLGSPNTATVTINDNETSNGPNPIEEVPFFVRQQYLDFLNREPDPAGYVAWQEVISSCPPSDSTCDRIHVSSSFFRSPEFQGRGYFIYRFYPVSFGRKPDYDEFTPDLAKVSGFLSDAELEAAKVAFIAEFMSRPAFVATYSGLNNTQYVDTLLATAGVTSLNRDFWIAALGNGTRTRATVLRDISESPEVYNKYYNQAFVVMQYFGYLRRQPDAQYLDWIAVLDATGDFRGMINGFMNSTEYRARFGP